MLMNKTQELDSDEEDYPLRAGIERVYRNTEVDACIDWLISIFINPKNLNVVILMTVANSQKWVKAVVSFLIPMRLVIIT